MNALVGGQCWHCRKMHSRVPSCIAAVLFVSFAVFLRQVFSCSQLQDLARMRKNNPDLAAMESQVARIRARRKRQYRKTRQAYAAALRESESRASWLPHLQRSKASHGQPVHFGPCIFKSISQGIGLYKEFSQCPKEQISSTNLTY